MQLANCCMVYLCVQILSEWVYYLVVFYVEWNWFNYGVFQGGGALLCRAMI